MWRTKLRNRLYYQLKPALPFAFRLLLRHWVALKQRRDLKHLWPIAPGSERRPAGWAGWPEGKKFALVLTHDVESKRGLDRCRKLMELEKQQGFRSSFYFIPETSEYTVSDELRAELVDNGFEVGVHDLNHDGKLYRNHEEFSEKAKRINQYLKKWNAKGFRSGFMHHNLDWLHELNIQYDASTFDTDPFEPQPDGLNTIFPAWIRNPVTGDGYVELPYTLPQDSTLFLVLRERSLLVWKRKLAWIAKHGGMALINVHPDYMCFHGERMTPRTFAAGFYAEFLEHIRAEYVGLYWQPLATELANPLLISSRP